MKQTTSPLRLRLDPDELAGCVSCGLCLAHCPTFRVSGEEAKSPRGRITAMRSADAGAPLGEAFEEMMLSCVMCRACETACPSSVHFGSLMEQTRAAIATTTVPWWQKVAYGVLERPRLLHALTTAGAIAQRVRLIPGTVSRRLSLPNLPVRQPPLRSSGDDVWMFTGCVMDAWQRNVHKAGIAVLASMGFGVSLPGPKAACCGAMHSHAGLAGRAERIALRVMSSFPGESPILVDSAGCGAQLRDYGRMLRSRDAEAFSARVYDIHEWISKRADLLPPPKRDLAPLRIAVQDPCHLRHAQRAHMPVREVLAPYGELIELTDEGRCCGAGGAYSVLRPAMAGAIRDAKVDVIAAAGADVVASANPGCSLWLCAGGVTARHPMLIVAERSGLS